MGSRKLSLLAFPLALLTSLAPASATTEVTLTSPVIVVNNGPGDQTDGHVSGDWVAYTNALSASNEIRYHNLVTGSDAAIPANGASDFLSDISGTLVAFTRVTDHSAIMTFDVSQPALPPVELAPQAGSNRRYAQIGSRTVAWVDYGFNTSVLLSEIVTYDLDTKVATRLTNDTMLDKTPAVSPDGSVVVWTKCSTTGTGCQIWQAVRNTAGSWVPSQLTLGTCENSMPDSNGQIVAYSATCNGEADIYWQPVGGGTEHRLIRPGAQQHPTVSGSVIAFETYNGTTLQWDIDAYDTATDTLYHIANSLGDKFVPDVSVGTDGLVRVVWTLNNSAATGYDVYARKFSTSTLPATPSALATVVSQMQTAGCIDSSGVTNALLAKLAAAQSAINAGDVKTAINTLAAFINQVGAQSGKHILASCTGVTNPAAILIADAQNLINGLTLSATSNPITGSVITATGSATSGATVSLANATGTVLASATTDVTGFYYFATTGLLTSGATYTVRVSGLPASFTSVTPAAQSVTWAGNAITLGDFTMT